MAGSQTSAEHVTAGSAITTSRVLSTDATAMAVRRLGRLGLLPFVGLTTALYLDAEHQALWASALAAYALAILCFLVGAWWGIALIRRSPTVVLMSNAIVLVAFFGFVLLPYAYFFLLGALLFIAVLAIERWHAVFHRQPRYYARLRLQLSLIASLSLAVAAIR